MWTVRQLVLLSLCTTIGLLFISFSRTDPRYIQPETVMTRNILGRFEDYQFQPNEYGVCTGQRWAPGVVPLYIITPTYPRAEQIPELTRLGQTLLLVDAVVWLVAEDSLKESQAVKQFLEESGHCYVYLHAPMPTKYKKQTTKPRGVANRNAGLSWISANAKSGGVVYFADDDNTYDRRIFEEIRSTKIVSMFPVGLVTSLGVSTPIVRNNTVVDFYDGWLAGRRFPVDMAGFAFNVNYFQSIPNKVEMPFLPGREETKFLEQLNITNEDIEPLADECTMIRVWHTRTMKNKPASMETKINVKNSNVEQLRQMLWKGIGDEPLNLKQNLIPRD